MCGRVVGIKVRRFLQATKAPGQVALALTKLGTWMDRMAADSTAENPPSRIEVELAALETPAGLEQAAEAYAGVTSDERDRLEWRIHAAGQRAKLGDDAPLAELRDRTDFISGDREATKKMKKRSKSLNQK